MSPSYSNLALAEPENPSTAMAGDVITIESRFGPLHIDRAKAIYMPQGPLGFAEAQSFALVEIPGAEDHAFKLLQSLEDSELGFIVMPLSPQDQAIAEADLDAACTAFGVARADAAFMLIATLRRDDQGGAITTVNLRAPIILDTARRLARQVIFADTGYSMRHPLI